MTTLEWLDRWKQTGTITDVQHRTLSSLARKERFSLFFELNALLYLGVVSLAGGLAWTFTTHFQRLGDFFILGCLSGMFAGSLYYCFSKAPAYSNEEVESPNFVLDYVVLLSCLLLSVELGYIEFRFEWLRDAWNNYLLVASVIFFFLAYRFDNRFVLSLALSSLAGWFGVKVSRFGFVSSEPLRILGLAYGGVTALTGAFMYRRRIKKHFLETYVHIATVVAFISLLSGLFGDHGQILLVALLILCSVALALGLHHRKFAFVVYGIVFGYIGLSIEVSRVVGGTALLAYFVVTGLAMIYFVADLARRFGRDA